MPTQGRPLTDLPQLKLEHIQLMNDLGLWTVEDIAGIVRLSEINPNISREMIVSLFAYEFKTSRELAQQEFIAVIRASIPDHEWHAIAGIEEPLALGALLDDSQEASEAEAIFTASIGSIQPLPTRVSLPELYPDFFPDIRDQNQRGTCVAFATTALNEYIHGRVRHEASPRLSEEFLYWASRNRQYQDFPWTCHQCGTFIHSAMKAIIEIGQCTYETLPYRGSDRPCNLQLLQGDVEDDSCVCEHDNHEKKNSFLALSDIPQDIRAQAQNFRLADWKVAKLHTVDTIKRVLREGYPVAVGVRIYLSWYSPTSRHSGIIKLPFRLELNDWKYQLGGHAMLIVGYEDDTTETSWPTPGGGGFVIRNSWGTSWGDESVNGFPPGYGLLPYAYLSEQTYYAYALKPKQAAF